MAPAESLRLAVPLVGAAEVDLESGDGSAAELELLDRETLALSASFLIFDLLRWDAWLAMGRWKMLSRDREREERKKVSVLCAIIAGMQG